MSLFPQISYGDVMGKTLVLAVYDFDRFSKHDAIGEVRLPVCQLDLASNQEKWRELQSIQGDGVVSKEAKKQKKDLFCLRCCKMAYIVKRLLGIYQIDL